MADNFKILYDGTLDESDFVDGVATVFTVPAGSTYVVKSLKSLVEGYHDDLEFEMFSDDWPIGTLLTDMEGTEYFPEGSSLRVKNTSIFPQLISEDVFSFLDSSTEVAPFNKTFRGLTTGDVNTFISSSETSPVSWSSGNPNTNTSSAINQQFALSDGGGLSWYRYNDANATDFLYSSTTPSGAFSADATSANYNRSWISDKFVSYNSSLYLYSCPLSSEVSNFVLHPAGKTSATYAFSINPSTYPLMCSTKGTTPTFVRCAATTNPYEIWIPDRQFSASYQAFSTIAAKNEPKGAYSATYTDSASDLCMVTARGNVDYFDVYTFDNCAPTDTVAPTGALWKTIDLSNNGFSSSYQIKKLEFGVWPFLYLGVYSTSVDNLILEVNVETEDMRVVTQTGIADHMTLSMSVNSIGSPTSAVGEPEATTLDIRAFGIESEVS